MSVGLAAEEVAALGTAFLSSNLGPEVAATALRNFTGALANGEAATKRQSDVLGRLGFDTVDLAKRMQIDAKGAILDVVGAFGQLEAHERAGAISMLFGEEAIGSVTPLIENLGLLETAFGLVGNRADYAGSMTREYEGIAETTKSRLTVLTNSMTALSVVAGTALLPAFVALLEATTPMIQSFSDFAAANPGLIQSVAGLGAGLWVIRAAMLATNAAMMTNPIVAVIAAVAAGAFMIYRNWDGIVAYFLEKIDAVQAAFDEGLLNGVLTALAEFDPFRLMFEGAVNLVEYLTGWDLSAIEERIAAAFDFSLFGAGMRLIQSAWDGMLSIVGPMVSSISAKIAAIVPDWLLRAWDWVSGGGASSAEGSPAGRAIGGAVRAGHLYRWMEEGEELFVPRVDGNVISTRELKALRAGGARSSTTTINNDIVVHAAPGQSPQEIAREVLRAIERRAGRGAELHDGGAYAV
ncbi:phage tail tape measure protein [Amaricoccus sp.]|uniref:phage tail tape measure protein n=1 Tax=Amaricoccus sp. TaxID=1872485 RepID=UPI002D1FB4BC|nr:phage tail tape measure protein [Amaricoccus sp.]